MEISSAALPIYQRVLDMTVPQSQDQAEELFSLAAREDGNEVLSEEEARGVEETLDYYDQQQRFSLGIGAYDEEETEKVLGEYQVWESLHEGFGRAEAFDLEMFIQNHPQPPNLPKAYYNLGLAYFFSHEPDRAIAVFEKVAADYPETVFASRALQFLVPLYTETSRTKESLLSAEKWLLRPPYQANNVFLYYPYEEVKAQMLFSLAEGYRSQGDIEQAQSYYWRVINEGKRKKAQEQSYLVDAAKGALYLLGTAPHFRSKDHLDCYLLYRQEKMFSQADYRLYEKQDLSGAEEIYQKFLALSEAIKREDENMDFWVSGPLYVSQLRDRLEEIRLRRMTATAEILGRVEEMEKTDQAWSFLINNQNLPLGYLDGIPPGIYLRFLLLNGCKDAEEVRIAEFYDMRRMDYETKTPEEHYGVIFKSQNIWQLIIDPPYAEPQVLKFEDGDFEGVAKAIEQRTGMRFAAWAGKKSLFAGSLKDLYDIDRLSALDLVIGLEKQLLSGWREEELETFRIQLTETGAKREEKLASFAKLLSVLPSYHFQTLEGIDFDWSPDDSNDGQYGNKKIDIASWLEGSSLSLTIIHELGHHWSRVLAKRLAQWRDGHDPLFGGVNLIFYKINWISWDEGAFCWELWKLFGKSCSGKPLDICMLGFPSCGQWRRKTDATLEDFAYDYGLADGGEDFATSRESYVGNEHAVRRAKAREQMDRGNFEPAVQYLFNKYIVSFDPEDGLCFEYHFGAGDPPLSLAEVKMKLRLWLGEHPGSIAPATLEALQEIEALYEEFKLAPPSDWEYQVIS